MGAKNGTLEERFWPKVDKSGPGGCWLWKASKNKSGYGIIRKSAGASMMLAHRCSWEIHSGPIPDGLCACHRCDVRDCVNPVHLFLATNKENVDDMNAKGRGPNNSCENNPRAVLTAENVLQIRARRHENKRAMAMEFGVTRGTIYRAISGNTWREIG